MRDNRNDPTDFAVFCSGDVVDIIPSAAPCGLVFLDEKEYKLQLEESNDTWQCPHCGSTAEWDDDCRSTNPPEDWYECLVHGVIICGTECPRC